MAYTAHPTAVIDEGCIIGEGSRIWHFSHIMPGCEIGENCNIGQNVVVSPGVKLGNNVKVQNNVSIYTGVECEDDVFLGPSMVFTNVINPRSAVARRDQPPSSVGMTSGVTLSSGQVLWSPRRYPISLWW
jgi:UDP-2-acetamido-3-amino-2,3-dideoxy-glucuronate N-acetyltransferase